MFNSWTKICLCYSLLNFGTNLILFDVYKSDKIKQNFEAEAVSVLTFEMQLTASKCNRILIFR